MKQTSKIKLGHVKGKGFDASNYLIITGHVNGP